MRETNAEDQIKLLHRSGRESSVTGSTPEVLAAEKKETIRSFFDSIAPRYDHINQVLSWSLDDVWRKRAFKFIFSGKENSILDLGIGTGKFIQLFLKSKSWQRLAGLDFSLNMLRQARTELPSQVDLVSADFHDIPFQSKSFDLVISSFALRSVQDLPRFFREIQRLLRPEGKAALLCLTRPSNPFWKILAYPYLKFFLPLIGGVLSGHQDAYHFLSDSILSFQEPEKTAAMLKQEGFKDAKIYPFTLGLATLIVAYK